MNRFDLITALAGSGMYRGAFELDDEVYDPLSIAFVTQAWGAWVESLPPELQIQTDVGGGKTVVVPKWLPEVFDCDNLARDFGAFINRCAAVDAVKLQKPRGNVAAGKYNFWRNGDPAQAHARVWFVDYDNNAHSFDPGDGLLDGLSLAEKLTIFGGESV